MKTKNQAFTLVEVIVSIAILSVVMVSVFEVYFSIINLTKRLELTRILQENARGMTEAFATEIREKGVDLSFYDGSTPEKTLDYSEGNSVLSIRGSVAGSSVRYYLMMDSVSGPVQCPNPLVDECYLGREIVESTGVSTRLRLTDTRAKVEKLAFYIVGASADSLVSGHIGAGGLREAKVTIVFQLSVPKYQGLDPKIAEGAVIRAETTIAEKLHKSR